MPKIERKTQKIFGGNAESDQLAVFGTMITGTPVYNDDIETLQSEAYTEGWQAAVAANEAPFMEEMNGVQYGFSKQLAYLFQQGIAEWDAGTTYYLNSFCQVGGVIYKSMQDENINHSPADDTEGTYWSPLETEGGGGLEICDIGMALYIDETKGLRRRLNGTILDINTNTQSFLTRLQQITTLYPSLVCTEEEWQAAKTLSAFGQVGKFVYNYGSDGTTVVSVRLPAVVNIQGLIDLQNLGVTVAESLPNITGTYCVSGNVTSTGAFYGASSGTGYPLSGTKQPTELAFSASRSSSTYQDNAPVQPEAIQYPYFIQIATGQETEVNITNEIELNNPYTLFDSKYSPDPLYNASWLKSDGEYKPKATYVTCYEALVVEQNSAVEAGTSVQLPSGTTYVKRGLSVKLSTAEDITDYDFVINTADETFRLPLLDGSENVPDFGASSTLITQNWVQGTQYTAPKNGHFQVATTATGAGQYTNYVVDSSYTFNSVSGANGVTNVDMIPVSRGSVLTISTTFGGPKGTIYFYPNIGNGSLYYYVGETVQNANLIDAGRIGEQLADKVDMLQASGAGMPSNKYIDLTLGASQAQYTAPANGWFTIACQSSVNNGAVIFANISSSMLITLSTRVVAGTTQAVSIPCKKGDVIQLGYDGTISVSGANYYFRFIYAQGAQGGS